MTKPQKFKQQDYEVDAEIGNRLFEVRIGEASLRNIRTALMLLAYVVTKRPGTHGFLVLPGVKVTRERLNLEWRLAASVFQTDIMRRLTMCINEGNHFIGIPRDPDQETQGILTKIVREQRPNARSRQARGNASFVVLKILLHHWLTNGNPVTTDWLARTSGYTYPTVAAVLSRLGSLIERQSDRRIRFRWFPREEYARLLAMATAARSTIRFVDRSGQPRSPESHLRRLEKLAPPDIAIGGVLGARHYFPNLDLVGTPRLDLSIHCQDRHLDLGIIAQIDPALKQVDDPLAPANLAVHAIHHAKSLFTPREGGLAWADPVECLLDLHEIGLEMQAKQFLDYLQIHVKAEQLVGKLIDEK